MIDQVVMVRIHPYSILLDNMQEASDKGRRPGVMEYIGCLRDRSYVAPMGVDPASQLSQERTG